MAQKVKKPIYKRIWFWVLVVLVIAAIGGSMGGNKSDSADRTSSSLAKKSSSSTHKESSSSSTEESESSSVEESSSEAESSSSSAKPKVPMEYTSALVKAQAYSDSMYMSKAGIYDQLTSQYGEQFSPEAANYALANIKADYNKNALEKAKDYQTQQAMSPESIREQLTSSYGEKFTPAEAAYAIANLPK